MGNTPIYEKKRDADAAALVRLVKQQRVTTKKAMASRLGLSTSRVGVLIRYINDPDSAFKPLRYYRGRWVVVSFDQYGEAMSAFEIQMARSQVGILEARKNNMILAHQHLGSESEITKAIEQKVLAELGVDYASLSPNDKQLACEVLELAPKDVEEMLHEASDV